MSGGGRLMQRCMLLTSQIRVGAILQQQFDHVGTAYRRRLCQRCRTVCIATVDLRDL